MERLNWDSFTTALLYGCMMNKNNNTYYWRNLTLNKRKDLLTGKSDMFISCFWHALSLARKEGK